MKLSRYILLLLPLLSAFNVAADDKTNNKSQKVEKPSGIFGTVFWSGLPPTEEMSAKGGPIPDCEVIILSAKDRRKIKQVISNKSGAFTVLLPPGKYIVFSRLPKRGDVNKAKEAEVTVWCGFKTEVYAMVDAGW